MSRLLQEWSSGDRAALDRLIPIIYKELNRLAKAWLLRELTGQRHDRA